MIFFALFVFKLKFRIEASATGFATPQKNMTPNKTMHSLPCTVLFRASDVTHFTIIRIYEELNRALREGPPNYFTFQKMPLIKYLIIIPE